MARQFLCIEAVEVFPPIPTRRFDWCAYREGREESGPYGYGATRGAAVAELFEWIDENDEQEKEGLN